MKAKEPNLQSLTAYLEFLLRNRDICYNINTSTATTSLQNTTGHRDIWDCMELEVMGQGVFMQGELYQKTECFTFIEVLWMGKVRYSFLWILQNRRDLPRDNPLVSTEVLRLCLKGVNVGEQGNCATEMELRSGLLPTEALHYNLRQEKRAIHTVVRITVVADFETTSWTQ
ncbi:hypothetical protein Tco_1164323 [Tanacetum coccineum]